jgi:hypothetical protein
MLSLFSINLLIASSPSDASITEYPCSTSIYLVNTLTDLSSSANSNVSLPLSGEDVASHLYCSGSAFTNGRYILNVVPFPGSL